MGDRDQQLQEAKACADIIRFQVNGETYPDKQAARVEPNQRLIEVFGIDNAFTNPDINAKKEFSREAGQEMRLATKIEPRSKDEADWTELRKQALFYFDDYMTKKGADTVDLVELTQFLTLELSLFYLFDDARNVPRSTARFNDVLFIGHHINTLWIDSKGATASRPQWADQTDLHAALHRVLTRTPSMPGAFPMTPAPPDPNPLNWLLPAYETMWRVVLRCFLELRFRRAADGAQWYGIMTRYLEALARAPGTQHNAFHATGFKGVRPVDVVKEALHLYPPTRRVHRTFHDHTVRADIEACQRTSLLGGFDPLISRPGRWQAVFPLQRDAYYEEGGVSVTAMKALKAEEAVLGYMPFAFSCAADNAEVREFGMRMVGLLVGVLCEKLKGEWVLDGEVLGGEGPLSSEREAYEGLTLRKVENVE